MTDVFLTQYKIYRRGDNYLISDCNGRDVFYYNIKSFWQSFPQNINVNTAIFNDPLMDFSIKQLSENNLNESKIEFYYTYIMMVGNRIQMVFII